METTRKGQAHFHEDSAVTIPRPGASDREPNHDQGNPVGRRVFLSGALGATIAVAGAGCARDPTDSAATTAMPFSGSAASSRTGSTSETSPTSASATTTADPAEITSRTTVPVLCWHQLREWEPSDSDYDRQLLVCPPKTFRAHLDAIVENGWSAISPDDYLRHLATGAPLPAKPVLLTFDDSQGSQITHGLPELMRRDLKATFFIMTVVLGNTGWMTKADVKNLARKGMTIGGHTWDHHRVDEYSGSDWQEQLVQPRKMLETITGKPVEHFAYPFGAWNPPALTHVAEAGYRTAFQLDDKQPSTTTPLLTLKRSLVNSTWTGSGLHDHLTKLTS